MGIAAPTHLYYDADSLERGIREFEHIYGVSSPELFDAYVADELPSQVPRFAALVWVSFIEDVERLRSDDPPDPDPMRRIRNVIAHA